MFLTLTSFQILLSALEYFRVFIKLLGISVIHFVTGIIIKVLEKPILKMINLGFQVLNILLTPSPFSNFADL